METHEVSTTFNISRADVKVIRDIIEEYSGVKMTDATLMLRKIFASDIKPAHYMCLGYLIGEKTATEKTLLTQKQLFLCLKQN